MVVDLFKRRRGIWVYRVGDADNPASSRDLVRVLDLIEEGKRPVKLRYRVIGMRGISLTEIPISREFIEFGNEPGMMFIKVGHPSREPQEEDLNFVKEQLENINKKLRRCMVGYSVMDCTWTPMRKISDPIIKTEGEFDFRPITGYCLSLMPVSN